MRDSQLEITPILRQVRAGSRSSRSDTPSIAFIKFVGEASSADQEAATAYHPIIEKIIKDGKYSLDQVFNADETGLLWRKSPSRTFMTEQQRNSSGIKISKDRISLLFCSNASGSLNLKPMMISHSENPRALKNRDKSKLPVHGLPTRRLG